MRGFYDDVQFAFVCCFLQFPEDVCVCARVFSLKKKTASAGDLLQLFSQKLAGDFFSWGSKAIKPQKAGVSG